MTMPTAETVMNHAAITAAEWLRVAVKEIDMIFGKGYAAEHPELVSGFLQAAALDQAGMYLRSIAEELQNSNAMRG